MKYKLAIFDFDGTLADSFPFFLSVYNHLAEKHHFRKLDLNHVPALRSCSAKEVMNYVGLPKWKLPVVARSFLSLMKKNADNISLFENVSDVLRYLADCNLTLAIVTSNSIDNVLQILGPENTKLIRYFECGISAFGKQYRIRKVLRSSAIPRSKAIYIGDQLLDLEAARKEKVAFGAVSWGYGEIESLRKHAPEEEFLSVSEIKRIA